MTDDTSLLLKLYEVQWDSLQHNEDQRAQITNMVLLIASAIVGFIAQKGLHPDVLPLTVLLLALGVYGALISEKYYERWWFFRERIIAAERKLDLLHPAAEIPRLWREADETNAKAFPRLNRVRLHHLWLVLHLGIAAAGIILTLLVLLTP